MRSLIVLLLVMVAFSTEAFAQCVTNVSGTIAGQRWTRAGSPYCVVGNISVASLIIDPGVIVNFRGPYRFDVAGVLTAIGTQQDSIRFRKDTSSAVAAWKGIAFISTTLANELSYCVIEGSDSSGIRNYNSTPRIRNCTIRRNTASSAGGGGLYTNSPLTLDTCVIQSNRAPGTSQHGGGIYSEARLTLNFCKVQNNVAESSTGTAATGGGIFSLSGGLTMSRCIVSGNLVRTTGTGDRIAYGGGIYLTADSLVVRNCIIENDSAYAFAPTPFNETSRGGGVYIQSGVATFVNSIIAHNSLRDRGSRIGGGVHVASGDVSFLNSTIAYNRYEGLRRSGGTVSARNSIFFFNGLNLDPQDGFQILGGATVTYSDVQVRFDSLHPGQGNINAHPIFRSLDSLCIIPPSRCIDSGDPAAIYNDVCISPNGPSYGTIRNDIGAHGGPGACNWPPCITSVGYSEGVSSRPTDFRLSQNYPNPFNPETQIEFRVASSEFVELKIFDLLGREAATLVNERMNPGTYSASWDASGFASGVYLYRMKAGSFVETRKLLLLR